MPDRVTRTPSDVLRAVVAGVLLLVVVIIGLLFDDVIVDNLAGTMSGLDTVSGTAIALVASVAEVAGIIVLGGGLVVALVRRQWLLVSAAVVAGALAVLLVVILRSVIDAEATVA